MLFILFSACENLEISPPVESAQAEPPTCADLHVDRVAGWDDTALPLEDTTASVWPGAAIADVTGDGRPDVIAAFAGGVLLGQDLGAGWALTPLQEDDKASVNARSVAAADVDDDGDVDLFLGGELPAPSRILYNRGDGTFDSHPLEDFLHRAWTGAFGDFTGDGRLDVFVATYDAELSMDAILGGARGSGQALVVQGEDGSWTFADGAVPASTHDALSLQGAPLDYDGDGDLDVYLANDFGPYIVPDQLLVNDGRGGFTVSEGDGSDIAVYAMGAGVGDPNGDGWPDLFVSDVGSPHYLIGGDRQFADATQATGAYVPPTGTNLVSWGVAMADMDQDGWDDVLVSYGGFGSAVDVAELANSDPEWEDELQQDSLLLHNEGEGTFTRADASFTDRARGRALAVGDLDLDGRPDLVTVGKNFLHIFQASGGCDPGVAVRLHGPPGNVDGFGARVDATVAGRLQSRWMLPSVTAGQSAREVYVGTHGLPVDRLTVTWPDGTVTEVGEVEPGTRLEVDEE